MSDLCVVQLDVQDRSDSGQLSAVQRNSKIGRKASTMQLVGAYYRKAHAVRKNFAGTC